MKKTTLCTASLLTALLIAMALLAVACGGEESTDTSAVQSSQTTAAPATESGQIKVSGLVESPMTFAVMDTDYMNWVTVTADDPSGNSKKYEGVKLSEAFDTFGVQSSAKSVVVTGSDGKSTTITLADISKDALLAVATDKSFSLVMPGMKADAWVQDVVAMEFK